MIKSLTNLPIRNLNRLENPDCPTSFLTCSLVASKKQNTIEVNCIVQVCFNFPHMQINQL